MTILKVDYRTKNNISVQVSATSNSIVGYTTYGGHDTENERTVYFDNASDVLPEGFFEKPFKSYRFVLLEDPYEIRVNPNYEKLKAEAEEKNRLDLEREDRGGSLKNESANTVTQAEYDELKAELEAIKKALGME